VAQGLSSFSATHGRERTHGDDALFVQQVCLEGVERNLTRVKEGAAWPVHLGDNDMALKMMNSEVNGTSVVTLDGRIVLGEESKSLREKLKGLIAEGKKQIVLNMENITYIDSTGLGTLVASQVSAKTQGASLKLCNLGRKFQELLQLTKLLTVFEVCNTEAAAVASFSN
jgi:anti-sigma B factor antagonist